MSEEKKEEWVIRDEASEGYWKSGIGWREEGARYGTYADAASEFEAPMLKRCLTARIIPAPPREMTEVRGWEMSACPICRGQGELDDNAGGNCSKCEYCAIWASAVEKAVREEREAVVQYMCEMASPNGYYHFVAAAIERGEHRK